MPVAIRKLSAEEAHGAFSRRSQQDLSDYVDALRTLEPGQAAAVERQDLSDRALKRRLGQAARTLGYRLNWSRHKTAEMLDFQFVWLSRAKVVGGPRHRRTKTVEPVTATESPAPRARRGRGQA
jgi:hypothetical protein